MASHARKPIGGGSQTCSSHTPLNVSSIEDAGPRTKRSRELLQGRPEGNRSVGQSEPVAYQLGDHGSKTSQLTGEDFAAGAAERWGKAAWNNGLLASEDLTEAMIASGRDAHPRFTGR